MNRRLSDEEILDELTIPGLNVEAKLDAAELRLLLDGVRAIARKQETRAFERANGQIRYYERRLSRYEQTW
jgi:hypothetical protein